MIYFLFAIIMIVTLVHNEYPTTRRQTLENESIASAILMVSYIVCIFYRIDPLVLDVFELHVIFIAEIYIDSYSSKIMNYFLFS